MISVTNSKRAYTLIEALVASAILMIGIGAASSLSLAMVTREEINERAARTFNHVDNAARLVQLGLDPATVTSVLPACDTLVDLTIEPHVINVPGLGTRNRWWIKFGWETTNSESSGSAVGKWTGGVKGAQRVHGFYVYRSEHFLDGDLPRVQWVKANP